MRGARSGLLHIRELECADESADHDVAFRFRFTEIAGAVRADGREDVLVFAKRMAVHVVAENLLLGRPHLQVREHWHVWEGRRGWSGRDLRRFVERVEEVLLTALAVGQP